MSVMGKVSWYLNRLKAMSLREIVWRVGRKRLQTRELRLFATQRNVVSPLYPEVEALVSPLVASNGDITDQPPRAQVTGIADGEAVRLLGAFEYARHATDWHSGFNTPDPWPLVPSYSLDLRREGAGDPRLNWELNRHRQFVRLACAGTRGAIDRLEYLVDNWASENPFLWGISWTSPMEIAIRAICWMTAARMLPPDTGHSLALRRKLLTGAANMAVYLTSHQSGYSSANNHLLVETAAIAIAGLVFHRDDWTAASLELLSQELPRQFSPDGVNLESSLHYHGFVLEAYMAVARELTARHRALPPVWRGMLPRMARFIGAAKAAPGVYCAFGDDDGARILDTGEGDRDYYDLLLDTYRSVARDNGLQGIDDITTRQGMTTFKQGGYSFFRRGRIFAGIDHAPLGFGTIAAHGHADALSFQLFVDGHPLLIDSGTYLYHTDRTRRDKLRSSLSHNTVTIDGHEQSQMLGPFLWGKKAVTTLLDAGDSHLTASVKGLSGVTHTRRFQFPADDGAATLRVADTFDRPCSWKATFIVAPGLEVVNKGNTAYIGGVATLTTTSGLITVEECEISPAYATLAKTSLIRISGEGIGNEVTIGYSTDTDPNTRQPGQIMPHEAIIKY